MTRPFVVDLAWGGLLAALGLNARDVLRAARLPVDLFDRARPTLGAEDFGRLFETLCQALREDVPALTLGRQVGPEAFSPPLFAAYCSPNARVALSRLQAYKPLIGPVTLDVRETAEGLEVEVGALPGVALPADYVATELVFLLSLVRRATQQPIRARRVEMLGAPKGAAAQEAYRDYFGCDVAPGARNRIVFRGVDAERPFLSANPSLFEVFAPELQKRLDDLSAAATLAERVRAALMEALPAGQADLDAVAGRLAMSRRTLQRRLGASGLSFQEILQDVRERLARDYLTRTTHTSAEISFLLGYEDPNSFIRAFHGWTGTTPERLRSAAG